MTWDGTGEDTTTLFSQGQDRNIKVLKRIKLPHSLGQFYSAVTNFIGFDMFGGDEWKVMGLAAYGKPEYYDFLARKVLTLNGNHDFHLNIRVLDHHLAKHYQFGEEISRELGPPRRPDEELTQRHWNIAASAQKVLEDTALHLLKGLHERTGEENLCMAGGVAFNSVMNGRIMTESPFKNYFVQPAAGDAGCSLGAALLVHHQKLQQPRKFVMEHAYYGPGFTSAACKAALDDAGLNFETLPDEQMLPRVAQMMANGAIIGWFQGRMEFGPRALGNRSFIADPRRADMRELLNRKVKLREWFRPLAPSMKEEVSADMFGHPHHDPFMITVLHVTPEQRERFPAVVHVDGTARPQTVSRKTNPRYWSLITEFEKLTGCPMVLNTSFNIQEPIVCRPEDAIKTFQSASFDALVLENHLVLRQ
jgi:carbamoyltransferase